MGYDYKEPFKADDTKFLCLKVKAASEGAVSKSNLFLIYILYLFAENCFIGRIEEKQG